MSNIIYEPMEAYRARKAMSAGMAWRMVNECPLLAWHHSPFNPGRPVDNRPEFDIGTAAHLAILEPEKLTERVCVVDCTSYKTKAAQLTRDAAYNADRVPLRLQDWELVHRIGHAIELQCDLFRGGRAEATYIWDWDGVPCKARVDYLANRRPQGMLLIDLKTAASSSPVAFQRAMTRDGHHLRAAWYLDGWEYGGEPEGPAAGYRFVVVGKDEPHIVTEFEIDGRSLAWGRLLYRKALGLFKESMQSGVWRGYGAREKIININLPAFAENLLISQERAGEFYDDDNPF